MPSLKLDFAAMLNRELPCPPDEGRNLWLIQAARKLQLSGCKPEKAADILASMLTRPPKRGEIEHTLRTVYSTSGYTGGGRASREKAPSFSPLDLRRLAAQVPFEVTHKWLSKVSPMPVENVTPSRFLDAIYKPGERIAIKRKTTDDGFLYEAGNARHAERVNRYVKSNPSGAWYYSNPMNGSRLASGACYGDELLTDCRHFVLECDHDGYEQAWLRALVQLEMPILAIYTSGNVSTHALVRIDASTKEEFNRIKQELSKQLCLVGADYGAMSATRATRLPGVIRGDNGREQRLLYLNPNATAEPIWLGF